MKKFITAAAGLAIAGLSVAACGSAATPAAPAATRTSAVTNPFSDARGVTCDLSKEKGGFCPPYPAAPALSSTNGCSQINSALDTVFDGSYAGLPPAKTTGDLLDSFLGQSLPVTSALAPIMAEHGTAPGLRTAEARLNADVTRLDNTSYVSSAQSAVLVPDLKAISDICGPATWTHVTLDVATTTPNGAPTTPATPAATYPWVSAAQWGAVSRNPDSHAGETYTISGTVSEYNINSNTFASAENAALVATDGNGNTFVLEADSSLLGNAQPGQTFTAKISVIGSVTGQNTTFGGQSQMPDLDAKTFHITG